MQGVRAHTARTARTPPLRSLTRSLQPEIQQKMREIEEEEGSTRQQQQ